MISKDHPYHFMAPLFERQGAVFNLSRYVYAADSLFDEREYVQVEGSSFTFNWLEHAVNSLKGNQELAFHSEVSIKGRSWHIPMIDFAVEAISEEIADRVRRFLPKNVFLSMAFYRSGRSFHAYSVMLLSPKEWREFMGRLLLINPKAQRDIIDSRWVGHRLYAGFSSLRWTNNSGLYSGLPKRVAFPGFSQIPATVTS